MGNEYSIDLRKRVIKYVEEGGRKSEACRIYQICSDTIYRWIREYKKEGGIKARLRKVYKTRKIEKEKFVSYIEEHPDDLLEEIAERFKVSIGGVWKACRRWKITRKKNSSIQGKKRRRTKSVSRRDKRNKSRRFNIS